MSNSRNYNDFIHILDAELVVDLKNGGLFESKKSNNNPIPGLHKINDDTCKQNETISLKVKLIDTHAYDQIHKREYKKTGEIKILNREIIEEEALKIINLDPIKCWMSNVIEYTCGDDSDPNNIVKRSRPKFDSKNFRETWNGCTNYLGIRVLENDKDDNIQLVLAVRRDSKLNPVTSMREVFLDIEFVTIFIGFPFEFFPNTRERKLDRRSDPKNMWNRNSWFVGYEETNEKFSSKQLLNLMSFESFTSFSEAYDSNKNCFSCNESRKKRSDSEHPYFKGLSKSTIKAKKSQMKAQAEMSDDDPSAYRELPGDSRGRKKLKKSAHTSRFEKMYGK